MTSSAASSPRRRYSHPSPTVVASSSKVTTEDDELPVYEESLHGTRSALDHWSRTWQSALAPGARGHQEQVRGVGTGAHRATTAGVHMHSEDSVRLAGVGGKVGEVGEVGEGHTPLSGTPLSDTPMSDARLAARLASMDTPKPPPATEKPSEPPAAEPPAAVEPAPKPALKLVVSRGDTAVEAAIAYAKHMQSLAAEDKPSAAPKTAASVTLSTSAPRTSSSSRRLSHEGVRRLSRDQRFSREGISSLGLSREGRPSREGRLSREGSSLRERMGGGLSREQRESREQRFSREGRRSREQRRSRQSHESVAASDGDEASSPLLRGLSGPVRPKDWGAEPDRPRGWMAARQFMRQQKLLKNKRSEAAKNEARRMELLGKLGELGIDTDSPAAALAGTVTRPPRALG